MLMSFVGLLVCLSVCRPIGFRCLSLIPFITESSYVTCRLVMSSIFGVTMSKVKDTVTLNVEMVSADYLEYYISQSHHMSHVGWSCQVDDPY